MECNICQSDKKDLLRCSCDFQNCLECFQAQNKVECAQCKHAQDFTQLKPKFAKIARQIQEQAYFEDELIHGLPGTQQWLDYTVECEEVRKQLRQGIRVKMPTKPSIEFASKITTMRQFSCPSEECRGFVSESDGQLRCGGCRKAVCTVCREIRIAGHLCKKDILENLKALDQDSKECPTCGVRIHRTEGCNHMFCTHCGNHFDWASGQTLRPNQSTNGHYRKTEAWSKISKYNCDENFMVDSIPSAAFETQKESPLQRFLQNDLLVLRNLYKTKQQQRLAKHIEDLMSMRVKYLRKQIDEATFKSKLFVLNEQYRQKNHDGLVLETLLGLLKDLQVFWQDSIEANRDTLCVSFLQNFCQDARCYHFKFQFENPNLCFLVS